MIIDAASVALSGKDGLSTLHLSEAGGLTQFGAYIDTLAPGSWSSARHWHDSEDEFAFILSGTATLHDDDGMHDLQPGDAVAWRHGDPNAHHLTNRTEQPCRWLIVGARAAGDICHYPDDGRRQVNGATRWQILSKDGAVLREGDLPPELLGLPPAWGKPFDGTPARRVLRKGVVTPVSGPSSYPAPYTLPDGRMRWWPLSDEGGLTQFGAFTEQLAPGAQSSQRHWHEAEDEFLYVLDGALTVVEDDGEHLLQPGDAAGWPAGNSNAHCLVNRSGAPVTYLIVGTRWAEDDCHYPDIDLHFAQRDGMKTYTRKDGTPYPGWPKRSET